MISNYILILSFGFLGTTLELMSMEMFPGTTAAVSAYGSPVCQKAAAVSADHSKYSSPLPVGDMNSMVITTPFGLQLSPIPLGLQPSPIPHMTLSPASGNATASPASRGATASPTVYAAIQTSFGSTDAESTMTDSSLMSPLSSSAGAGSSASIKITNLTNPNVQTSKKERQQKSNDQALKALKGKLGSPSFMNEPNLNVVQTIFSSMRHTDRQTKKQAAKDIATALNGAVIAGAVDEEGQNLQLSKFLQDPSATKPANLFQTTVDSLKSEEKRKFLCVDDLDHVVGKRVKRGDNGDVIEVQGSHNLSVFDFHSEISTQQPINAFVDTKGVVGFFVGGVVAKTAVPDLTKQMVVSYLRSGRTLARGTTNSKKVLTQAPDGMIVESYEDKRNPLIHKTQYPVITVDVNRADTSGSIVIGFFGKIKSDLTGVDPVKHVSVSQANLEKFMDDGIAMKSKDPLQRIVDITKSMNAYLADDLRQMGQSAMPGVVYAIGRKP